MRCLNKKGRLAICMDMSRNSEVDTHWMQKGNRKEFQRNKKSLRNRMDLKNTMEQRNPDRKDWNEIILHLLWLNVTLSSIKGYGEFSKKEETILCTFNGRNDTLVQCGDIQLITPFLKACINLKLGIIDNCRSLNIQDKPVPLCKEVSISSKVHLTFKKQFIIYKDRKYYVKHIVINYRSSVCYF